MKKKIQRTYCGNVNQVRSLVGYPPAPVTTGVKPERSGRQKLEQAKKLCSQTSHRHDGADRVGVEVESAGQKEGGKTCYTVRHGECRLKKR